MTPDQPLIAAEHLVAGYLPGVNILEDCTVVLGQGDIVGIIGPNGAGKSTLLKAMFGLVNVRAGEVRLRGEKITNVRPHTLVSLGVGYVPQTQNVFPRLTVRENLEMGLYLRPSAWGERFEIVGSLFPLLRERLKQRAGDLSGGERQMVAMARALMMNPGALLLDEPSAGLAPAYQDQVFDQITKMNSEGVSIIMVEQNARRCLEVCNRAYVLDQGRNAYSGPGSELLNDDRVVDLYLGSLAGRR